MIGLVYNPHTNKGHSVERMKSIKERFGTRNIPLDYRESLEPKQAIGLAAEVAEKCDVVIASGGDGTVFEVVNGCADKDVVFAVYPMGSGNDIARSLGVNDYTDDQLIDMVVEPKVRDYDLAKVNDEFYMVQFTSFGLVSDIINTYQTENMSSYTSAIITAIKKHRPVKYKVITPEGEETYYADFISVQNTRTSGSGMVLCNEAIDNDGFLDLIVVKRTSFFRALMNAMALKKGRIDTQPNYIHKKVTSVTIIPEKAQVCTIDGELMMMDRVDVIYDGKKIKFAI